MIQSEVQITAPCEYKYITLENKKNITYKFIFSTHIIKKSMDKHH